MQVIIHRRDLFPPWNIAYVLGGLSGGRGPLFLLSFLYTKVLSLSISKNGELLLCWYGSFPFLYLFIWYG